jgi:hypothetical protein
MMNHAHEMVQQSRGIVWVVGLDTLLPALNPGFAVSDRWAVIFLQLFAATYLADGSYGQAHSV